MNLAAIGTKHLLVCRKNIPPKKNMFTVHRQFGNQICLPILFIFAPIFQDMQSSEILQWQGMVYGFIRFILALKNVFIVYRQLDNQICPPTLFIFCNRFPDTQASEIL